MQNKQVRDLAWVINSPSLVEQQADWPNIASQTNTLQDNWVAQWLLSLDADPSALLSHLAKEKSHFIGAYFESLWAFYLLSNPNYDLIAKNLQANSKTRTEGEFDFIVFDIDNGHYIHQEVAIKFYLGFSKQNHYNFSDGQNIWLGPQCKDRLDLKMDKMLNSQINLSNTDSGKKALKSINIDSDTNNIKTQLIMKGYLFYPPNPLVVAPDICNQNHLRGLWFRLDELKKYIEESDFDAWALLNKPDWVSPYCTDLSTTNMPSTINYHDNRFTEKPDIICAAKNKIVSENRPWMIACLVRQENGCYLEGQRLFAVPDDWPQIDY